MAIAFDDDIPKELSESKKVVDQAKKDFRRSAEWESNSRKWWREDTKFANADARNGDQWPETLFRDRTDGDRPCLTINKTRTHNRIIINEAMQNKSSIKVRPTGGEATFEASEVMQSIIRRIEYISRAEVAYRTAIKHQVDGGFGYVTLTTDYISDHSFDQDIFIRRVRDPLGIFLDPDSKEPDGSDANFGFEFSVVGMNDFYRKYPKWKNKLGKNTLGADDVNIDDNHIQQTMYYRRSGNKDKLISYVEPQSGEATTVFASEQEDHLIKPIIAQIQAGQLDGNIRDVIKQTVNWFLIAGDEVIDSGLWPGRYVPIVRCVGEELVIDGQVDRKGMTRYLIDQQRMLNYNASGQVEFGALQNKAPYVGPARAFEGQEQWKDANRKNYAFLQYNDVDDEAPEGLQEISRPERQEPPQTSPVYAEGMMEAEKQMMMASGQYQAQMGENENAKSGRAISERQRQGDTATYHFIEHQGDMFRALGMQLLDLIPKIYDTPRLLHILGEDGTKMLIQVNPQAQEAVSELKHEDEEVKLFEFNPNVGEYECMADVGPNYATQRQEAWNAITMILQQNAELAGVIGDLLFKYGDFPGADEIMDRYRKEIAATKPYLFNENADPGMISLQTQLQQLTKLNSELMQKYSEMQIRLKGRDEKRDIEAFRAETDRSKAKDDTEISMLKVQLEAITKLLLAPQDQKTQFERELRMKALDMTHEHAILGKQHVYGLVENANEAALGVMAERAKPQTNGSAQ